MQEHHNPESDETVTVVDSIQVARWNEFTRGRIEHFEPKFSLEGGRFPDDYAIPQSLAQDVQDHMNVDPAEHGIRVIDTDEWETY